MSETTPTSGSAALRIPAVLGRSETGSLQSSPCPTCGGNSPSSCPTCAAASADPQERLQGTYVYAVGNIEPRFPTIAVEKELAQAIGRAETVRLTDRQAMQQVLAAKQNRYIVRHLCWVLVVQGLDTYVLRPRNGEDFDLLIESFRPVEGNGDIDVVIGNISGVAPPEMCNGLTLPIVTFDQIYSFDQKSFIDSIPRPPDVAEAEFEPTAQEVFGRIMQMTGNAGAADQHRALNYLAMRYPDIYRAAVEAHARNATLSAVEVRRAPLGQPRSVLDVIFSFSDRKTDVVSKSSVRVDVSEEFPFLVARLAPYYDR
jgi:hypothetical protein